MTKRALITGITGQDGSYLAELLLEKGYEVHGLVRRTSLVARPRIDHLDLHLHYGDITDPSSLTYALDASSPHEIYNLAGQSHVQVSFESPSHTSDVVYGGTLNLLETVLRGAPDAHLYQAGSSEMFGNSAPPQDELTRFDPQSPYAVAKVAAHHLTSHYRDTYGLYAVNGIAFNHESPRRGENFLTRKVTLGVGKIVRGEASELRLGNLTARRDWGYAPEYVEAMWLSLQQDHPDDYVIATGETVSVGEWVRLAFEHANLDWHDYVVIDPRYLRSAEVLDLRGDASKARRVLGWEARTHVKELVKVMVEHDIKV